MLYISETSIETDGKLSVKRSRIQGFLESLHHHHKDDGATRKMDETASLSILKLNQPIFSN